MIYEYPLMQEEVTQYVVPADIDISDLFLNRPGGVVRCEPKNFGVYTGVRQWYEPIEDEV